VLLLLPADFVDEVPLSLPPELALGGGVLLALMVAGLLKVIRLRGRVCFGSCSSCAVALLTR
jgi:hypothetical protein